MIELPSDGLSVVIRRMPAGSPDRATIGEHVLATGIGSWWADRSIEPRVLAVSCAGYTVLRGAPEDLTSGSLAPLAGTYVDAPAGFLPALGAAFGPLTPWERMVWTRQAAPQAAPVPLGVSVRRLEPADTPALDALGPDASWIAASWGGSLGLASSGHAWGAVGRGGRLLALACTYFLGTRYEDVAVYTVPDRRRHRLGLACVTALSEDIAVRGHVPSWNCSLHNRPSRLLAWMAGFRLVREYVHYAVGSPVARDRAGAA